MMYLAMFSDLFSSRPVIDVPVDAGDDGVVVTESVKALCIDARAGLVIVDLAGGYNVLFAAVVIDELVGGMIGFVSDSGVDVLAGVDIKMVAAAMVDLEFIPMRLSLEDSLRFCC